MKTRQIHGLGLGEFLIFAPAKEMLKSAYFFSALIFDYDDFLQQKKRPPIFTNQRAHDVTLIFFIKLTLLLP